MNHEGLERRQMDRRGFLGVGGIAAGGVVAAAVGPGASRDALTDPFLGEIILVPYTFAPRGFVFCEGQALPISQNQALYSLLGNNFGGDGRTRFNLPDTRPVEEEMRRAGRTQFPPFRYVIALQGIYPSRA